MPMLFIGSRIVLCGRGAPHYNLRTSSGFPGGIMPMGSFAFRRVAPLYVLLIGLLPVVKAYAGGGPCNVTDADGDGTCQR